MRWLVALLAAPKFTTFITQTILPVSNSNFSIADSWPFSLTRRFIDAIVPGSFWTIAELYVGIITGSLPPCRALFVRLVSKASSASDSTGEQRFVPKLVHRPLGNSYVLQSLSAVGRLLTRSGRGQVDTYRYADGWSSGHGAPRSNMSGIESLQSEDEKEKMEVTVTETRDVAVWVCTEEDSIKPVMRKEQSPKGRALIVPLHPTLNRARNLKMLVTTSALVLLKAAPKPVSFPRDQVVASPLPRSGPGITVSCSLREWTSGFSGWGQSRNISNLALFEKVSMLYISDVLLLRNLYSIN